MQNAYSPTLVAIALTALSMTPVAPAAADPEPSPWMQPADDSARRSDSYRAGQQALETGRWSEAVDRFAEAAAQGGDDADGALYWQAYALHKMNHAARAQVALEELQERFPDSRWVDDAQALEIELQQGERRAPDPEDIGDDELKLIALNTLVHLEWERARPMLEKFLSDSSPRMKERALFVLSQSDEPEARQMLLGVARNADDPELAGEAIHYLAFYDDDQSRALLRELYSSASHAEVREQVLQAMMIADDLDGLLSIARSEPDKELREMAVEQLGILDARDELRQLYADEASVEVREQILEALMLADDQETLLTLARTEPEAELRSTAIEMLGLLDAIPELRELYRNEKSPDVRGQIAEALMLGDDADFLIEIAQRDPDAEVRERAIEGLGMIHSPAARSALSDLYGSTTDVEMKEQIIESFMLQDDASRLVEIARLETDPELRRAAIETLSMMDSEEATSFLLELLEDNRSQ